MTERTKVLIVGAGPTGLVMAHELARDGIECRLIDKAPHRAMESRAIAIHSRTMTCGDRRDCRSQIADGKLQPSNRIPKPRIQIPKCHCLTNFAGET